VTDRQLLARLDRVAPIPFAAQAFRHIAQDRHPLSGAGAHAHGGRWNPPESFATLYLALERETTVREFHRLAKRQGRDPEDFLPRRVYRYDVRLTAVLDVRDAATRVVIQLSDHELRADNATACQKIGEAAHHLGLEGILAPSATGAGTVLALFSDRLNGDSRVQDLDYEEWVAPPEDS
jgi:RES domain-containing protein